MPEESLLRHRRKALQTSCYRAFCSSRRGRLGNVYHRADPADLQVLDGGSAEARTELLAQRLEEWKSASNAF